MDAEASTLETCTLRDRTDRAIGRAVGWRVDERTGEPSGLSVRLDPKVREELGAPDEPLYLDGTLVLAIRRDEIQLDRTVPELREMIEQDGPVLVAGSGQR